LGKIEDEISLLKGAVALACTIEMIEISYEEFHFQLVSPQFNGKEMWLAIMVQKLNVAKKFFWDLDPEDLFHL
jgi:hypothetical protein